MDIGRPIPLRLGITQGKTVIRNKFIRHRKWVQIGFRAFESRNGSSQGSSSDPLKSPPVSPSTQTGAENRHCSQFAQELSGGELLEPVVVVKTTKDRVRCNSVAFGQVVTIPTRWWWRREGPSGAMGAPCAGLFPELIVDLEPGASSGASEASGGYT